MDTPGPITVTMVSITSKPPSSSSAAEKPPPVPPRSKKRISLKDPTDSLTNASVEPPPELPSRSGDLAPPPIPPSSTKPAAAKQILQTKQLLETEFLRGSNPLRQVLVAATKSGRDRRPESRQRQPALLIRPDREPVLVVANLDNEASENIIPMRGGHEHKTSRKGPHLLVVPASKGMAPVLHPNRPHMLPNRNQVQLSRLMFHRPPGPPPNGHILLPQAPVPPLSYGKWLEKSGNGDPEINTRILRRIFGNHGGGGGSRASKGNPGGGGGFKAILPQNLKAPTSPPANNSKSKLVVSRSGSLSSQYSSCSDSGDNDSQPKSVLKKSRRNKGMEKPKKSVTFNAMTTVQVMEE